MSERYPDAHIGAQNLLYNRLLQGQSEGIGETMHTPPSFPHYHDAYDWDAGAHAIVSAEAAMLDSRWLGAAHNEIYDLIEGIDENGMLPNIRFAKNTRKFDPERILAFERGASSSNYTQPPIVAHSVHKVYEATLLHDQAGAKEFLTSVYPALKRHYDYFDRELTNSPTDKLVGIYHPHMTGRDSDPTFDNIKPLRLPRRGAETSKIIDKMNIPIDYASILWLGIRLRRAKGDVKKMRETYWVNDVMMNCIYADNLREMEELAWETSHIEDAWSYKERALETERHIIDKMWFPDARNGKGAFLALDSKGKPITEISISNVFPLCLRSLSEGQLESVLDMMDESFNVNFPLPSVATDSPNYDPRHNETNRIWRGSTWMITNWLIVQRGLRMQLHRDDLAHRPDLKYRCAAWGDRIASTSRQLVDQSGRKEFYDPDSGDGQRECVVEFGWSNLAYVM